VLQVGFGLWVAYGVALGNFALIVPNTLALLIRRGDDGGSNAPSSRYRIRLTFPVGRWADRDQAANSRRSRPEFVLRSGS
jgi:hypothetical protein